MVRAQFYFGNILHMEGYDIVLYRGPMQSIHSGKSGFGIYNTQLFCKCDQTPAPIAAHASRIAIGIVIDHPKVLLGIVFQQNKAIRADPEFSVT
jgi:hypothetical protein